MSAINLSYHCSGSLQPFSSGLAKEANAILVLPVKQGLFVWEQLNSKGTGTPSKPISQQNNFFLHYSSESKCTIVKYLQRSLDIDGTNFLSFSLLSFQMEMFSLRHKYNLLCNLKSW